MTWQIADSHRAVLKYTGAPADIPGTTRASLSRPSAKGMQYQGSDIWQAELNSVLSESVLLNAAVGFFANDIDVEAPPATTQERSPPRGGRVDPLDYYNYRSTDAQQTVTATSSGSTRPSSSTVRSGSHEVKVGAEYSDMEFNSNFFYNGDGFIHDVTDGSIPGGYQFQDINGDGYFNSYVTLEEPLETNRDWENSYGDITTFFAQDAWRPHPNVTVKPGVRWDNDQARATIEEQIADMDRWQPRLGIAWDIAGNSKYVLRASGGRFMDPTALSIPSFASGVTQTYREYSIMEFYCNATRGLRVRSGRISRLRSATRSTGPTREGIEYVLFDNRGQADIYEPAQTLDQAGVGHLEAPYADEFILAFETQIARETSIELTYVNKKTKEIIEDTCANNTWAWGDGDYPSLDDDTTWTTAGDCSYYMITNMPDLLPQVRRHHPAGRDPARPAPPARQLHLLRVQGQHRQRRGRVLCDGAGRLLPGSLLQHRRATCPTTGRTGSSSTATISSRTTGPSALTGSSRRPGIRPSSRPATTSTLPIPMIRSSTSSASIAVRCSSYCTTPDGAFLGTTDIFLSQPGRVRDQVHLAARPPGFQDLEPQEDRSHRGGYGLQRLQPRARPDLQLRRPLSASRDRDRRRRCRTGCRVATRSASGSSSRPTESLTHTARASARAVFL